MLLHQFTVDAVEFIDISSARREMLLRERILQFESLEMVLTAKFINALLFIQHNWQLRELRLLAHKKTIYSIWPHLLQFTVSVNLLLDINNKLIVRICKIFRTVSTHYHTRICCIFKSRSPLSASRCSGEECRNIVRKFFTLAACTEIKSCGLSPFTFFILPVRSFIIKYWIDKVAIDNFLRISLKDNAIEFISLKSRHLDIEVLLIG